MSESSPFAGADTEDLAQQALRTGQAALVRQDNAAARPWLDRAHRLVPSDPNVMLALASASLDQAPAQAAALFHRIAHGHDVAPAWLGLAAARWRDGDAEGALAALAHLLSRHVLPKEVPNLIGTIAAASGWCGLSADGRVVLQPPAGARGRPVIRLDGQAVDGGRLPAGAGWTAARRLTVQVDGQPLTGSPIRIDAIRRVTGCVEAADGGIRGWVWHPADPDADPELTLHWPALRRRQRLVATDQSRHVPHTGALARVRSFALDRAELPIEGGLLHVLGADGRDLLGSPLDPLAETAGHATLARALAGGAAPAGPVFAPLLADAPMPSVPAGADGRSRGVTVIVPVHDGFAVARACLRSVLASVDADTRVLVVDDGSTDADLIGWLDGLAAAGRIRLVRHAVARGFPSAVNAGMRAARGRDVLLLNSDTLVPPGWIARLRAAARSAPDIGTVTPLSNDASILSYPAEAGRNPRPEAADVVRLDRLAQRANGSATIDVPVGVGFCLYIRRDCLDAVGPFRADLFAQGYGEENDFCLRARRLGWRSVALPGLFVGHLGGASFGAAAVHLRARNGRILERLHPGHDALIADWAARDPLAEARRRLDLLRWRQGAPARSVLLVTHDEGGGVEARIADAVRAHRAAGLRAIVLRPARAANGFAVAVNDGTDGDFANLLYALPDEADALLALLRAARPRLMELHHLAAFPAAFHAVLDRMAVPHAVFVHDYAWFCPRIVLLGRDQYCGEPDVAACEACIADHGHFLAEPTPVAALRERSERLLLAARRVVVPSDDTGERMRRHFPGLRTETVPHEDDAAIAPSPRTAPPGGRARICIVGGIGVHKGYDILLACARDAARRDLPLEFVVVGNSIDDGRLMATGRVFVTGRFQANESVDLIRAQHADLGFVPSVLPETWCLALGDLWRAGLSACAFDFGAPAERIRRTGRGFVLPVGLPPAAINNALVSAVHAARENAPRIAVSARRRPHVASGPPPDFAMQAGK